MKHLAEFFDDTLCGIKKADKRDLVWNLSQVTCEDCFKKARLEAIENVKALDTLPHCPHCGERAKTVTVSFNVTKVYTLDVMTERDYDTKTIKPLIYGVEADVVDNEMVWDKMWQVSCENDHEWFTKKIDPIEDEGQWFVREDQPDEVNQETPDRLCPVCGNDRSEHDWEVHTAEMKAGY